VPLAMVVTRWCHVAYGVRSAEEITQSSTWRELKAVRMTLQSLVSKLKNKRVKWFSDNQNVVRILEIGSKNPLLQEEALAVFSRIWSPNGSLAWRTSWQTTLVLCRMQMTGEFSL